MVDRPKRTPRKYEDGVEAAARRRRAIERCTRGAGVVAEQKIATPRWWGMVLAAGRKALSGQAHSFSHHPGVGEAGEIHWLGPRPPEAVLVVFSSPLWPVPWPFLSSVVLGYKTVMPKPLLEVDAPWSGSHDGPSTWRVWS